VGQLWVQDHLRRGTFRLYKVRADENPADLCTKHLTRAVIDGLIEICGIVREAGRVASAPKLNVEAEHLPTKEPKGPVSRSSRNNLACTLTHDETTTDHGIPRTFTHDETTTDHSALRCVATTMCFYLTAT